MPDEGWLDSATVPVAEQGSMKNPKATLAAGKALSDRMRGRAEFYRVMNRTRSKNDYDFDARTIDALLALAASNDLNETHGFDNVAMTSSRRRRDRGLKAGGGRPDSWRLGTTAIKL
jgi:hypothetical protein